MENKTIRIAGIIKESIVDGPGIRYTVFTQGCNHHCIGCHNPETHDFNGGFDKSIEDIYNEFIKDPILQGITLSGGEPIEQVDSLLPLTKAVKDFGKNVVLFTGYTIEHLLKMGESNPSIIDLLRQCFLVIDGPFIESEKDLTLVFRGSRNQRLIDPIKSIEQNKAVLSETVHDIE